VADRALACVVHQVGIPRILLDALLEGFAWDAEGRQYETLEDLHDYAARVAGTVGAMMSMVMSTRTPSALARACELGLAMQLTNIARDVGEDARAGRLFLPRQWLREAGVDPDAWLQQPEFSPAIARWCSACCTPPTRCTGAPNVAWPSCRATAARPFRRRVLCTLKSAARCKPLALTR
jgi:phytoene synthase